MTQKKKLSGFEKLRESKLNVDTIGLVAICIGGVLLLGSVMALFSWSNVTQETHLTNPDMPHSEYPENASYTWTVKEMRNEIWSTVPFYFGVSALTVFCGLIICYANVSKKDLHLLQCTLITESRIEMEKYCPECGLKLSELDKK